MKKRTIVKVVPPEGWQGSESKIEIAAMWKGQHICVHEPVYGAAKAIMVPSERKVISLLKTGAAIAKVRGDFFDVAGLAWRWDEAFGSLNVQTGAWDRRAEFEKACAELEHRVARKQKSLPLDRGGTGVRALPAEPYERKRDKPRGRVLMGIGKHAWRLDRREAQRLSQDLLTALAVSEDPSAEYWCSEGNKGILVATARFVETKKQDPRRNRILVGVGDRSWRLTRTEALALSQSLSEALAAKA